MKKRLNLLFLLIGALFFGIAKVGAAPIITSVELVDGDLYYVRANPNGSTIAAYVVGSNQNHAISFNTPAEETYISVPNGSYKVWAKSTTGEYSEPYSIYVTTSCSITYADNKTDTGTFERCYRKYYNGNEIAEVNAQGASCAPGYNLASGYTTLSQNDCGNKKPALVNLEYRYCKKVFSYKCLKIDNSSGGGSSGGNSTTPADGNAKLSSLSISTGSITPNFSSSTYNYAATTSESSVSVSASLISPTASFVEGYGPRTVNLNYGNNDIVIKSRDGNTENTYVVKIKRADSRSSVNTLSSLSLSNGTLSPTFNGLTTIYDTVVDSNLSTVDISATLTDPSSSFVEGYGPRTVAVTPGYSRAAIKVKSQSGSVRTYSIIIGQDGVASPAQNDTLLESLVLSSGEIDFDSNTFDYNVSVPYDVTNIAVNAKPKHENDKVNVSGGDNLELDKLNEITIVVTSEDGTTSNTYTIYVTRKEQDLGISSNNLLQDLSIDNYKIKFDAKTNEYDISLKNGEKELVIHATPADEKSIITIEGNENLANGSKIKIRVTSEDGKYNDYFINIKQAGQGGSVILTVIIIILIVLAMAYLVLRAMGYKIYFNLGGIKDKITNRFKKN